MHIWVISQSYKPEPGAASARYEGFAPVWEHAGAQVSILTATPQHPLDATYEDYADKPSFFHETLNDVSVYRHYISRQLERNTKTTFMAQLSFTISLLINLFRRHPKRPDVVIATSPTILPAFSAWLLARRYGAKFVYEIREPWPELFLELGRFKDGRIIDFLVSMQKFIVKRADLIITPTKNLANGLERLGADTSKIEVIPLAFPEEKLEITKKEKESGATEALRTHLQIGPMTKIVMYLGNHGQAQALGQVIEAAKRFLNRSDVLFLFVGQGSEKQKLKESCRGMPNIQFIPEPPEEKKWTYYGLANVCLVPLKDINAHKKVSPSKLIEILGAGRPCVAAVSGVTADMLNEARTALTVPPENDEKLAYAILKLLDNPEKAEVLGKKAQAWVKEKYTSGRLGYTYFAHMKKLLNK